MRFGSFGGGVVAEEGGFFVGESVEGFWGAFDALGGGGGGAIFGGWFVDGWGLRGWRAGCRGGFFGDGFGGVVIAACGGFGRLVVFLEEVVGERGVKEAVDVEVLGDEEVVAFVVFAAVGDRVSQIWS